MVVENVTFKKWEINCLVDKRKSRIFEQDVLELPINMQRGIKILIIVKSIKIRRKKKRELLEHKEK